MAYSTFLVHLLAVFIALVQAASTADPQAARGGAHRRARARALPICQHVERRSALALSPPDSSSRRFFCVAHAFPAVSALQRPPAPLTHALPARQNGSSRERTCAPRIRNLCRRRRNQSNNSRRAVVGKRCARFCVTLSVPPPPRYAVGPSVDALASAAVVTACRLRPPSPPSAWGERRV